MRRAEKGRDGISIEHPPSTSTNAIARRGTSALGISPAAQHGGRGLLAGPAGAVTCELEPVGLDASGARYELRVHNATPGVLTATATAVRVDEGRPVAALGFEIEPHAAIRTGFTLDAALAYERVSAEVNGEGIHIVVEAPPPRAGKPRRPWLIPAMGLGVAGILAGGTLLLVASERPRVVDLELASVPKVGLLAHWVTAGNGRRTYELRDASGNVLASGTLPSASGSMVLGPKRDATLHVAIANGFGADVRDAAYATATPPPAIRIRATPPPRIASLQVDPPRPNAPLTVHYTARARDLRLAIVDRTGATWFSTTTPSGSGITQVPAPPAGPREPYQLVARAEGSSAGEETRVPIPASVVPSPSPIAAPSGAAASAAAGLPANGGNGVVVDVGGGDTFAIRPDPVRSGQPFVVEIPFADGAQVSLVRDSDGADVAGASLRQGERSVALVAPRDRARYTVRVTLQRGMGNETLVRPLHVAR